MFFSDPYSCIVFFYIFFKGFPQLGWHTHYIVPPSEINVVTGISMSMFGKSGPSATYSHKRSLTSEHPKMPN